MTILVGIPACARMLNNHLQHATPARYAAALMGGSGVVPVMIPPVGEAALAVLDRLDGLLLPGSPSNVHPSHYGADSLTPDMHDQERDGTSFPLIHAALQRDMPLLAICRGIQELNVALGGSLHQRLQDLPGRMDHSTPLHPNARVRTGKAHAVSVVPGSWLHRVAGAGSIAVNSLHNQGINVLAPGLVVEGTAADGTIEAVRLPGARALTVGVQWHPEYDFGSDAVSHGIFAAFGRAVREQAPGARLAAD